MTDAARRVDPAFEHRPSSPSLLRSVIRDTAHAHPQLTPRDLARVFGLSELAVVEVLRSPGRQRGVA